MIGVSNNFKTRRKSGVFRLETLAAINLPVSAGAPVVSSFTANFPGTAVTDGDRTHLNLGPINNLYPPPAGPENFIGMGMWKASAAVPQTIILNPNGAKVGRIKMYTHADHGGIKSFQIQVGPAVGGPWTTLTDILSAVAYEQHNGFSTVTAVAGTITAVPTNANRPSIPSVFDIALKANHNDLFFRINITDAGLFAFPAVANDVDATVGSTSDGFARCCEIELYRREDISTPRLLDYEISHSLDVTLQGITTRQVKATLDNTDLLFSVTDFQRPVVGTQTIDVTPEIVIQQGIDGEFVSQGTFSIDEAQFSHPNRKIEITGRSATERPLFDHQIGAFRSSPLTRHDQLSHLIMGLSNQPLGLARVPVDPNDLGSGTQAFAPTSSGRDELEQMRTCAADRGVYIASDGTLASLDVTVSFASATNGSLTMPLAGTSQPWGSPGSVLSPPRIGPANAGVLDQVFFDPVTTRFVIFGEQTFASNAGKAAGFVSDTDVDRLSLWDVTKPFNTRTLLAQVFGRANTVHGATANNAFSIPGVVARRPTTNNFYFLCSGTYGDSAGSPGTTDAPKIMSAWTIANGVAAQILTNQTLGDYVTCAAFIGNILYWWENSTGGLSTLKKWDVTTAFAPVAVGTEGFRVDRMVTVGTLLYYSTAAGNIVKLDPANYAGRTNALTPFAGQGIAQLRVDAGVVLWGSCGNSIAGGFKAFRWDTTTAAGTMTQPAGGSIPAPMGALAVVSGVAYLFNQWQPNSAVPSVELWDGTNNATPTPLVQAVVINGTPPSPNSGAAVAPSWYGGRFQVVAWQPGILHWMQDRPLLIQDDTLPQAIVHTLHEKATYELGGANTSVNAVDIDINDLPASAITILSQPAWLGPSGTQMLDLQVSADPNSLGTGPLFRRHARYPLLTITAGAALTITGTGIVAATSKARILSPLISPNQSPSLTNVRTISNKYMGGPYPPIALAYRIMREAASSLRWFTADMLPYPEVEIGDILLLNFTLATNIVPFALTGRFRVAHLTHHVSGSGSAQTTLELISTG